MCRKVCASTISFGPEARAGAFSVECLSAHLKHDLKVLSKKNNNSIKNDNNETTSAIVITIDAFHVIWTQAVGVNP